MTDKEIIIDGVNVAGCGYFCETDKECSICGMGTSGEDTFCRYCKDNPSCYYKQLKRLEQENAELKAELQNFKDMAKKGLDEFKDVGGCWGCGLQLQLNQDMEDIKQLKAENDRLKEELDFLKNNTYREALREIREYINDNTDFDKGDYFQSKTAAYDILQIIALYGE